jgi:hypothetical protein
MGVIRNLLSGDTIGGELVPEVVLTDMEVAKEGSIYTPRFNGSTSKVDCGSYDPLVGDITVLGWVRANSFGESNLGRILFNGQLILRGNSSGSRFFFTSNAEVNSAMAAVNSFVTREYLLITIVRTAEGTANIYINGELSGSADQDSGTPAAGTQDIHIGNNHISSTTWDGDIPETIILSGLLTPTEISQYYSSTKARFSK